MCGYVRYKSHYAVPCQEVEVEKMKAIGSRNLLKSYTKQREAQQEQLRSLIGNILNHIQWYA
jgi:hypothetical protein